MIVAPLKWWFLHIHPTLTFKFDKTSWKVRPWNAALAWYSADFLAKKPCSLCSTCIIYKLKLLTCNLPSGRCTRRLQTWVLQWIWPRICPTFLGISLLLALQLAAIQRHAVKVWVVVIDRHSVTKSIAFHHLSISSSRVLAHTATLSKKIVQ